MSVIKEHGTFLDSTSPEFDFTTIVEISPNTAQDDDDKDRVNVGFDHYAYEVSRVMHKSWQDKFAKNGLMTPTEVAEFLPELRQQRGNIVSPKDHARYLLAFGRPADSDGDYSHATAVARVRTYKPRNPFKPSYPDVTDLESMNGKIGKDTTYGQQAATLLYFALREYDEGVKVSAYTEIPNEDGIDFYKGIGFVLRRTVPEPQLPFEYAHMEAPSNGGVLDKLREGYDL